MINSNVGHGLSVHSDSKLAEDEDYAYVQDVRVLQKQAAPLAPVFENNTVLPETENLFQKRKASNIIYPDRSTIVMTTPPVRTYVDQL